MEDEIRTCIYITGSISSYKLFSLFDINYKRLFLGEQYSDSSIKALLKELFKNYASNIYITNIRMKKITEYEKCLSAIWKDINHDIFFVKDNQKLNISNYEEFKEFNKEDTYLYIYGQFSEFNKTINNLNTNITFNLIFFINGKDEIMNTEIERIEAICRKQNKEDRMKYIYNLKNTKYIIHSVKRLEHVLNYAGIEITNYKIGLPYSWQILKNLINKNLLTYKTINEKGIFIKKLESNSDLSHLINKSL